MTQLYRAASIPQIYKPKIALVKGSSIGAVYVPGEHLIRVEEKLYNICREFKKDSLNALAFVIAHELSHAIQKHRKSNNESSNFLMTNDIGTHKYQEEREADLQGVFICYLAGYKPSAVIKSLIHSIYEKYNLNSAQLNGYPPKSERIKSSETVLEMANELIQLYECANILVMHTEYTLAELCYRYILNKYQGAEIYNNLGLVNVYLAIQLYDEDKDIYAYPFELDVNSNLSKLRKARGPISEEDKIIRKRYLDRGIELFRKALEINPDYSIPAINLICALNLRGEYGDAINFFESFTKTNKLVEKEKLLKLKMAVGISYALQQNSQSLTYFNSVIKSSVYSLKMQANHNIDVFNKCAFKAVSSNPCTQLETVQPSDDVFLSLNDVKVKNCVLDERNGGFRFLYQIDGQLIRYQFQAPTGPVLSIRRQMERSAKKTNFKSLMDQAVGNPNLFYAQTTYGNYLYCKQTDLVYLLDRRGDLKERIMTKQF
ncbi:MAG: hypothetical protein IPN15_17480 [Saprospiraceae bacterium]|nr:hypothetical protein [Candidatus Vicinibacter affinis]